MMILYNIVFLVISKKCGAHVDNGLSYKFFNPFHDDEHSEGQTFHRRPLMAEDLRALFEFSRLRCNRPQSY